MNRRELAKNTCLGLFGFLAAKLLPEKKEPIAFKADPEIWIPVADLRPGSTYTNSQGVQHICVRVIKPSTETMTVYGFDLSGPEWDDDKYWARKPEEDVT